MRPHRFALCVLALALLVVFSPAFAAWPHDPNIGNVPLCVGNGDQGAPSMASDGAGGAFYAWNGTLSNDIFVQHVSAAGVPLWTTNGVPVCQAPGGQAATVIMADGAGGAFVAWNDYRSGTGDIYAQRVNAAGVPLWTSDGVAVCNSPGDQLTPQIASDGSGGALIAWATTFNNADVYVQRVNGSGVAQWTPNGVALCTAVNDQSAQYVTGDGSGGAYVVWQDQRAGVGVYDVYGQHVNASGTPLWTANGLNFCTATGNQVAPRIVADASGGVITAWYDTRGGQGDIYAQHTASAGTMLWGANGVAICTATNDQNFSVITADGSGGAIIAWNDYRNAGVSDIYAQRINGSGTTQWAANGVALCTNVGIQQNPAIASDGAQGAVVAWQDNRGFNSDVFAQRVSATGAPLWTTDGVAVSTAVGTQQLISVVPDMGGGAIMAWNDYRNGTEADSYTQRVERYGQLGSPEPSVVNVRDVPADQGGHVSVEWNASYLDGDPYNSVASYNVWRQAPRSLALAAMARGSNRWQTTTLAGQTFYWELVGSQTARGFTGYSYVSPTTSDSVASGNLPTYFMIEARSSGTAGWSSAADSGYSVDNLAPATPAPFAGEYLGATTALHWGANGEADFAMYRLYRGSTSGFVPDESNRIATLPDTGYVDAAGAPYYYKLAAVDVHGNLSGYASLLPSGTVAVGGGAPARLDLAVASSNPARQGADFRFTLPAAGRVSLVLLDSRGRRVRELARGTFAAGTHPAAWDGRDDSGSPAASGIYFARLETMRESRMARVTLVR